MKRYAIFFAFGVLLLTLTPARANSPVTLVEYQRAVTTALDLVQQAELQPTTVRAPLLMRAANLLAEISQVQTDAGTVTVNNDALVAELKAVAQNPYQPLTSPRNRLRALRDAVAPSPLAATDDERAKLREIFNRPPFRVFDNPVGQLLNEFLRWLRAGTRTAGDALFSARDLFAVGGLVVMVGVLAFFIRNLRKTIAAEEILPTQGEVALTAREALARAQNFVAGGDYRSAMRLLYLAALLSLDERGALKYDPSWTNREHLRALAPHPMLAAALAPIVETFDRVWYGFANVTPDEFAEFRRQVQAIREIRN
ncbi:MAG: DUF4129 domain-containing protein [Chloroflexi bacterium]|nr:DUF4129 domain-containing protein [Chloroflexota bacterium]